MVITLMKSYWTCVFGNGILTAQYRFDKGESYSRKLKVVKE